MCIRDRNLKEPSKISEREVKIFNIVATSGVEGLDFYDEYNPKFTKGDVYKRQVKSTPVAK